MSTKYTTAAQDAARIRSTLKGCGITRNQVSVRARSYSMGSSIDIAINDPAVDIREVQVVAQSAEKIDRCQYSGEILCGGNRFLTVKYSDQAAEAFAASEAAFVADVIATAARLPKSEPGTGLDLANGMVLMRRDAWYFDLIPAGSHCCRGACLSAEHLTPKAIAAAALSLRGGR